MRKFGRKTVFGTGVFCMVAVVAGCGQSTVANNSTDPINKSNAGAITLIAGDTGSPGNSVYVFFHEFANDVNKYTQGKVRVELHDNGQLGGDQELVQALKLGTVDVASAATSNMAQFTNALGWVSLPYVFTSEESANKIWMGDVGNKMKEAVSHDTSTKVLDFIDAGGFRLLADTKKQIMSPNDLQGMKLRVTASPSEAALTKAWGGSPTPVPWSQTFTAVQQGVVNGLQLQPSWLALNGYGKAVRYAAEVNALIDFHVVQMNMVKWNSLSQDLQQAIQKAADDATQVANQSDIDNYKQFEKKLEHDGVKIYTPSESEAQEWKDKAQSVFEQYSKPFDKSLLDELKSLQK